MRPADLHTNAAYIRDAFEDLQKAWLEVSEQWSDGVSRAFCQNHLEPLGPTVKLALDSMQRMGVIVAQMQNECDQ